MSTPSQKEPFSKELDVGFCRLGRALVGGHLPTIANVVMANENLKELVMLRLLDMLDVKASRLCQHNSDSPSPFRKVAAGKLPEFSWGIFITELQTKAPVLFRVMTSLVSRNDHRNQQKKGAAHYPGICMAVAIMLKERNREICGIQRMISPILFTSRVQKQVHTPPVVCKPNA